MGMQGLQVTVPQELLSSVLRAESRLLLAGKMGRCVRCGGSPQMGAAEMIWKTKVLLIRA